jgi:hypothetical protein
MKKALTLAGFESSGIGRLIETQTFDNFDPNYHNYNPDAMAAMTRNLEAARIFAEKFDPATSSPLYGIGKEIYEFNYDIGRQRIMPVRVSTCSVRGSFGWPCLDYSDENLREMGMFYLSHYARSLQDFAGKHSVPLEELAERFMDGFEYRTHAMAWQLSVMRDKFETFLPELPRGYAFDRKWRFAMWSLERQERRLPILRRMFFSKSINQENQPTRMP